MSRATFVTSVLLILLAGGTLRVLWPRADPPTQSVGVVWHDEGAWVHNARNRALWGAWRTDNWNPVFIAPVFTALEYGAFEAFGVGTWQARTVPIASGLLSIVALMAGLFALGRSHGQAIARRTAVVGGALLAVNFTWVMWNRAALMESTMTAFIVLAWAAYARGERRPVWGLLAGVATVLAWFTKASAAFFAAALVLDALWIIGTERFEGFRKLNIARPRPEDVRTAWFTLASMAGAAAVVFFAFIWPHWTEYQFYNWQMTVTRKPSYDFESFVRNASWLPVVQDFFTRTWVILVGAALAILSIATGWRDSRPAERLLVLWILLGLLELTIHDSGNERRYVMFLPAIIALAALIGASSGAWLRSDVTRARAGLKVVAAALIALLGYLVAGSALRWLFEADIQAGVFRTTVRISAAIAGMAAVIVLIWWQRITRRMAAWRVPFSAALTLAAVSAGWDVTQYVQWSAHRSELNYQASVAIGRALPPGTLVHGKLANGLSLENQIRPVFVGRGFGNYDDRFDRDDARYILTIGLPEFGRDSQPGLIQEILDRYPNRRIIGTFDVDETPGPDQAWLIDKMPPGSAAAVSGSNRAPD